jgi:hypothetical protein
MVMKGAFRKLLVEQLAVEAVEHFARRDQAVLLAKDLLGPDAFLDKDGQQTGRDAVAHGVGHVKAQVGLVQAEDVVKVAADAAAGAVVDGEAHARQVGQGLRKQAALEPSGQFQLLVHLLVGPLEPLVDAMHLGSLLRQPVVPVLEAQEALDLGQEFPGRERPEQVGVRAGLQIS